MELTNLDYCTKGKLYKSEVAMSYLFDKGNIVSIELYPAPSQEISLDKISIKLEINKASIGYLFYMPLIYILITITCMGSCSLLGSVCMQNAELKFSYASGTIEFTTTTISEIWLILIFLSFADMYDHLNIPYYIAYMLIVTLSICYSISLVSLFKRKKYPEIFFRYPFI